MSQISISFQDMLDNALACIETLPAHAALRLENDPECLFVDLRDVRELERDGTIPGAFHCPRGMLEFWVHPQSPHHNSVFAQGKRLIFFCASGWRSALSTASVQDLGLTNVAHIGGGFSAWKTAGGPVQSVAKRP